MKRVVLALIVLIFAFSCTPDKKDPKIVGKWVGNLIINETVSLRIGCDVQLENDSLVATLASIDQGAYGMEINSLSLVGDSLTFVVNRMGVTYTGIFVGDTLIQGHFAQGPRPPLVLNFARADSIPGAPPVRFQNPKKPYPYAEEKIEFVSEITDSKLAGTLTYPKRGKDFPAVLLIPGSGPNDRDETIWGHKVFLVLADYLTRNGIAVLRMDDRGVGESEGDFAEASISDFADDAVASITYLKNQKKVSLSKIGLVGHSLGADIAPLAANRSPDVDFVVLMAGSGITLAETIHFQTNHIYSQRGASAEAIDLNRRVNQAAFDIATQDLDRAVMEEQLTKEFAKLAAELMQLSAEDRSMVELPEVLNPQDYFGFLSDNMRYDLFYNPCDQYEKLGQPILILGGDLDTQVSATQNIPLIQAALSKAGNPQVTEHRFPKVNHLFQTCKTGEVEEYDRIGETIAPIVLETMAAWIGDLGR